MQQNPSNDSANVPHSSAAFGNVPNGSEPFRTVRNDSASFRSVPKSAERGENHTLTVREAARLFEAAGVARTERSIVNWCQPNRTGIARLDSYFDPNERRYYISLQSVELAIAEEKAKAEKLNDRVGASGQAPQDAEAFRSVPHSANTGKKAGPVSEGDEPRITELEKEVMDLKITNRAKDFFVEQLQKERDGFFDQLLSASRKVGELETQLLQLDGPKNQEQ